LNSRGANELHFNDEVDLDETFGEIINELFLNKNDRVYFSDYNLFSNHMFEDIDKKSKKHFLHPLSIYTTSQVLRFLDYRTIMTKIRYLSKSFIWLTQEHIQYIEGLNKQALLRASLYEIYKGEVRMPI
jgi:hypothetical protein